MLEDSNIIVQPFPKTTQLLAPYPFQVDGVTFLTEVVRGILADEMGLGKTNQAITAAFRMGCRRILVVAPNSLLHNWAREIYKWLPGMSLKNNSVAICDGQFWFEEREQILKLEATFTLVPYSLLGARHTWVEVAPKQWTITATDERHIPTLCSIEWDCIIVDEAHRVINRHSNAFKALQKINLQDPTRPLFLVTGSPLLNYPGDLWCLLNLITPKKWTSYHKYLDQFCETKPSQYSKFARVVLGLKDPNSLKEILREIMLRRLKEDHLKDLPEKFINNVEIDLYDDQRATYETMRRFMYAEVHGNTIEAVGVLAKTTRERQIAVSPDILIPESDKLSGAKIDMVLELIEEAMDSGQKFVIFSQFAQVIRRLSLIIDREFKKKKINKKFVWFTGQMSSRGESTLDDRELIKDEFNNDPNVAGFGVTIQCGGEGHTLTAGSFGIMIDFMWSPLRNAQAVDRLHRIGQTKNVDIRVLVARETIEERVMEALDDKMDLFNAVIPVSRIMDIINDIYERDYGTFIRGRQNENRLLERSLNDDEFIYNGSAL